MFYCSEPDCFRYGKSSAWRRSAIAGSKLVSENHRKWIFLKSVTIRLTSTDNNIFYYILLNGFITMIYWIYYDLLNSYTKGKISWVKYVLTTLVVYSSTIKNCLRCNKSFMSNPIIIPIAWFVSCCCNDFTTSQPWLTIIGWHFTVFLLHLPCIFNITLGNKWLPFYNYQLHQFFIDIEATKLHLPRCIRYTEKKVPHDAFGVQQTLLILQKVPHTSTKSLKGFVRFKPKVFYKSDFEVTQ